MKSRQPGGAIGELGGEERGELGGEDRDVKLESSESSSKNSMVEVVVVTSAGARQAARLAACGKKRIS